MLDNPFQENLNNPAQPIIPPTNEENQQIVSDELEKDYLKKVRAKNKKYLVKLDFLERERIAKYIYDLYMDNKGDTDDLADKIDNWDDIYKMRPFAPKGGDPDSPNYRTPLSTVMLETIHADIMNVFFTPADIARIIPTEANDIPKVKKLDTFMNWSMKNEMEMFENCDRLFHSSNKNGECPYIVHWVKEYGTEIKTEPIPDPMNPSQSLIDPDTKEVMTQETEKEKLLYNGPEFKIFSRKDYIKPKNAMMDVEPEWEMRRVRLTADKVNRASLEGKYYDSTFDDIGGWGDEGSQTTDVSDKDKDKADIPLEKTEKIFIEFYGRLRIKSLKTDDKSEDQYEELEDEFIAIMEIKSQTLCQLKKNRFPLKMRPVGLDVFIPDDEGKLEGSGIMEFMESLQNCNDALYNQYLKATVQANDPFGFFSPTGNMKNEPIKISHGYLYPTSDASSVNIIKLPPPDNSHLKMMEIARNYSQLLFGISDYSAGLESQIDPSAPAKKAEIVVAQGNKRTNLIIKRKNRTLKNIFKKWFLLYQANMPPNKFMRIAGEDPNNPWKFEAINLTDFALKSIPDFELTGNILNSNKQLEFQKKLGIYQVILASPLCNPALPGAMQIINEITRWLLDGADETGLANLFPKPQGQFIKTPEEENAYMIQGDAITPDEKEDHINHIRVHSELIADPAVPDNIRKQAIQHAQAHTEMLKKLITQQIIMSRMPKPQTGGMNAGQSVGQGAPGTPGAVFPQVPGMAGPQGGNTGGLPQL